MNQGTHNAQLGTIGAEAPKHINCRKLWTTDQKLANGYFANGYFENPCKVPRMPPLGKRMGGKRLDPSDRNRRQAKPLKKVRLSSH